MGETLASLVVRLTADTTAYQQNIGAAGDKFTAFGARLESLGGGLTEAVTAPLAAIGAAAFANTVRVGELADRLLDLSDMTGLSTGTLQEYRRVAVEAGTESDLLAEAAQKLFTRFKAAGEESSEVKDAMAQLGVEINNADGSLRSMDQVFPEILRALQGMEDATTRNSLATSIFGRSATQIAPVLALTAEQFDNARREAHELGLVLSEDVLHAANEFRVRWDTLKQSLGAVANEIAVSLQPVFVAFVGFLQDSAVPLIRRVAEFVGKLSETQVIWIASISAAVAAIGPLLLAMAALVSALPALTAAVALLGGATGLGLIVLAIGAVTAAGVQLMRHWDDVKEATLAWARVVEGTVKGMWERVKLVFDNTLGAIIDKVQSGLDAVTGLFKKASDIIVGNSIVPDMADMVLGEFKRMADGMGGRTSTGVQFVTEQFNKMRKSIDDISTQIVGNLASTFGVSSTAIVGVAGGALGAVIGNLLGGLADALLNSGKRFEQALAAWRRMTEELNRSIRETTLELFGAAGELEMFRLDERYKTQIKSAFDLFGQGIMRLFAPDGISRGEASFLDAISGLSGSFEDIAKIEEIIASGRFSGQALELLKAYQAQLVEMKRNYDEEMRRIEAQRESTEATKEGTAALKDFTQGVIDLGDALGGVDLGGRGRGGKTFSGDGPVFTGTRASVSSGGDEMLGRIYNVLNEMAGYLQSMESGGVVLNRDVESQVARARLAMGDITLVTR